MLRDLLDCLDWRDRLDPREPTEPRDPKVTAAPVDHPDLLDLLENCLSSLLTSSSRETLLSRAETREKPEETPAARDPALRRTATWT